MKKKDRYKTFEQVQEERIAEYGGPRFVAITMAERLRQIDAKMEESRVTERSKE